MCIILKLIILYCTFMKIVNIYNFLKLLHSLIYLQQFFLSCVSVKQPKVTYHMYNPLNTNVANWNFLWVEQIINKFAFSNKAEVPE